MTHQLSFVQFPHPGGEGNLGSYVGSVKPWGRADQDHLRAFMHADGEWLDAPSGSCSRGTMAFWGEWEGASAVSAVESKRRAEPRYIHRPLRTSPPGRANGVPPQNTDPFVFGERFLYTYCKQDRNRGLRELAPGSVVLFGSKLGGGFVLDTVFVVGESLEHLIDTNRRTVRAATSQLFEEMTMGPMYGWGEAPHPRRLYLGATHEQPLNGRFSFVPCVPAGNGGFARPSIDISGWTKPNLAMGARMKSADDQQLQQIWEDVAGHVVERGLSLGVRIDEPASVMDGVV
jgi:hypothetical protein